MLPPSLPPSLPLKFLITAQNTCRPAPVRLEGLGVSFAGRVEVCVEGEWGAVCNTDSNQWSLKNAQVVCKELGYSLAINSIPWERYVHSKGTLANLPS